MRSGPGEVSDKGGQTGGTREPSDRALIPTQVKNTQNLCEKPYQNVLHGFNDRSYTGDFLTVRPVVSPVLSRDLQDLFLRTALWLEGRARPASISDC